eukprot:g15760.t1
MATAGVGANETDKTQRSKRERVETDNNNSLKESKRGSSSIPDHILEQNSYINAIGRTVRASGKPLVKCCLISQSRCLLLIRPCPCKLLMYISEAKSQNASKAAKKAPKKKRQTETWVHTSTFSFSSDIVTLDAAEMRGSGDNIVGAIVVGTYDGEIIVIDAGKIYVRDDFQHFELSSGRESAEFAHSLGVVRGVAKCCLVELSANKLGVLVDSFLEPMQLYSLQASIGENHGTSPKRVIQLQNTDAVICTTYILNSRSNMALFAALFGPNMALAQGNTVAAIHGYSDGSLRWVIIDSDFLSDSSPGGTMPPSRTESIEGLFLRMENTPVQHLLPVSEFHNEVGESSSTYLEGLVVIGGDGSIKVISYLKRNDGTFSDRLNDNRITTCGNHAIVESLTYRIRTPILSPCVVSGCLLCVSNRSTILRPLNKPALSSTSNTCTPSIQMPLAQNIVSLEALGRQSNKFFALASTGIIYEITMPLSKNTLALRSLENVGSRNIQGSRVGKDADSETRVKALLEQLSDTSSKEDLAKQVSKSYSMQLSDLSEMLHWISQFMHLFAKGEAFAASLSIDQRLRGDMSKLHHVRLSLAPKDRKSKIYFPASDAWQVVVKVTHSQSGSFKYTKTKSMFLRDLAKVQNEENNDIENEGELIWRFPLELQTVEPVEISVSLCAVLRNTQMLPRDRTNGNENNLITTLDQDDVVLLPISSHRLDVIDFVGLHHAGVVIPSNLNDALKQSIRNISLMNINGILQVQGGASLKLSDHGPISQVGFSTRAEFKLEVDSAFGANVTDNGNKTISKLKIILGKLIERPCKYTSHFIWRQNESSNQVEISGSLGRGHSVSVVAAWCKSSLNKQQPVSKAMASSSTPKGEGIMRYVKIQIACEHPLDLPFIREALLHRSTRLHGRDGHKKAIDSKNMTNAVAYNIDQEVFQIENELRVLREQLQRLNNGMGGKYPLTMNPALSMDITSYSARTSELVTKVAKLYVRLRST